MLVTDWGLVSACEGPPLRVLRRVLSTNPAEKGPDLGMMGARSVNRRHFHLSMLSFEAEAAVQAEPVPPVLPVLYLDDVMCAVMKPEKLLVHRTEIANGDTVFAVQCVREQLGRRVWPVHRLDRGTSGVLVFACDADTASRLGRIMMAGEVKKRYAAVVRGWLEESVDCRHPLSLPEDPYLKTRRGPSEPQDARTVFIERARGEAPVPSGRFETTRLGLVEAELFTGRRHQIRRHLKWLAHPVIGDATYGKGPLNRAVAQWFGADRLMLHCARMTLPHPVTGEEIDIRAPLVEGPFRSAVERLGWLEAYEELMNGPWREPPAQAQLLA